MAAELRAASREQEIRQEQQRAEQAERDRLALESEAQLRLQHEDAEQAALDAQREQASHAFAELSAAANSAPDSLEPSSATHPSPQQDASSVATPDGLRERNEPDDEDDYPAFSYDTGTDTAALLRELSSLGLDDDPPVRPPTRPAGTPRQQVNAAATKKKKGLFGRG